MVGELTGGEVGSQMARALQLGLRRVGPSIPESECQFSHLHSSHHLLLCRPGSRQLHRLPQNLSQIWPPHLMLYRLPLRSLPLKVSPRQRKHTYMYVVATVLVEVCSAHMYIQLYHGNVVVCMAVMRMCEISSI